MRSVGVFIILHWPTSSGFSISSLWKQIFWPTQYLTSSSKQAFRHPFQFLFVPFALSRRVYSLTSEYVHFRLFYFLYSLLFDLQHHSHYLGEAILFREFKCFLQVLLFFPVHWSHIFELLWDHKISSFSFRSLFYPSKYLFLLVFASTCPSPCRKPGSFVGPETTCEALDATCMLQLCGCHGLRCQETGFRPSLCLWALAQPSGSDVLSYDFLYLFAIPFLTRGSCCLLLQWHCFTFFCHWKVPL